MSHFRKAFLLVTLLLAGCGGLTSEPPIVSTFIPVTPTVEYPVHLPDLAVGASVFAERCTKCHGLSGAGDGELIGTGQDKISVQPASFRDAATTADQTPLAWYETITNGNLQQQMPPWEKALSTDERWAVALYTYTLHNTNANIEAGKALVAATPITTDKLPSLEASVKLTDADLITQVGLPSAFLNSLSAGQKNDLAAYVRSLLLTNAQHMGLVTSAPETTPEPATTPEVTQESVVGTGTITGKVTNGTAGASVPPDQKVDLYVITSQGASDPIEITVNADGTFTFANINIRPDQRYLVTTKYKGRAFGSEAKDGDPVANKMDLPVTVYETTSDASQLTISAWVSQIQADSSGLQVIDLVFFNNPTDKAYSMDNKVDDQRFAGIQLPVPANAQILSADVTNARYTISTDGHSVIDTAPVLPGANYVFQMAYRLPYQGDTQIEQPVPYAVDSNFRILFNTQAVTITSDTLKSLGPQDLNGTQYQVYSPFVPLAAGGSIRYRVQGGVQSSTSPTANVISANQLIPLVLVGIGLIAIITAVVVYWRSRPAQAVQNSERDKDTLVNGLIQQIAELDESYRMGSLDEEVYQKRRDRLKARLAALLDEEKE